MLEGSIGNFTSRVLATFAALPRALRLGVPRAPRGTWQLFVLLLVGFALDGLVLLASSWRRASPTRSSLSSLAWSAVVACGELLAFTATRSAWLIPLALEFKVIAGIAWSFCVSG